jgi:general secretion pathway protein D
LGASAEEEEGEEYRNRNHLTLIERIKIMKTTSWKKIAGGLVVLMTCALTQLHAQGVRPGGGFGGGGFGGGGFGGFGGGGFGGFGGNRGFGAANNSSSSSYNNNGSVGGASFMVDPDTHTITYIADKQTSEAISNVIANLDRPKPQVLIKVVFLEVQMNNGLDIGVEGGWTGGSDPAHSVGSIFGLTGLNNVATNFTTPVGPAQPKGFPTPNNNATPTGAGGLYQILGSDYQATVRALATEGKAHVLARPSILARDGQPATILIGSEVPLITGLSYQTVGAGVVPINNITYTPVGLQVNVTPYISPNNNLVEMIVTPEDSEIDPNLTEPIGGGVEAPVIDTRSADTVVITPDAQTVVIGGLIENNKQSSANKIPILGDVPIIGALFRTKSSSDNKNELMIFLTPHIVHAPTELAATANASNLTSGMITNSVSEQQLDRFLNKIPNNAR